MPILLFFGEKEEAEAAVQQHEDMLIYFPMSQQPCIGERTDRQLRIRNTEAHQLTFIFYEEASSFIFYFLGWNHNSFDMVRGLRITILSPSCAADFLSLDRSRHRHFVSSVARACSIGLYSSRVAILTKYTWFVCWAAWKHCHVRYMVEAQRKKDSHGRWRNLSPGNSGLRQVDEAQRWGKPLGELARKEEKREEEKELYSNCSSQKAEATLAAKKWGARTLVNDTIMHFLQLWDKKILKVWTWSLATIKWNDAWVKWNLFVCRDSVMRELKDKMSLSLRLQWLLVGGRLVKCSLSTAPHPSCWDQGWQTN